MHLRSLQLQHVRMFGRLELDFTEAGQPRPFTVILAENGCGKSTLLQAIAIAAVGATSANKLVRDGSSFVDRRAPRSQDDLHNVAEVAARFSFDATIDGREFPGVDAADRDFARSADVSSVAYVPFDSKTFYGEGTFDASPPSGSRGDVLSRARDTDARGWFVIGYGTSRTLPSPQWFPELGARSVDRLQSLFSPSPLVATAFADVLAKQFGDEAAREYSKTLARVLIGDRDAPGLLPNSLVQRVVGFELRGQGGVRKSSDLIEAERFIFQLGAEQIKLPATWLSSGFQSTIAWVADLLGHYALDAGAVVPPAEMRGLVLIDELDLHLHPRWQMELVPALRRIFPKLQFIATTHSPLILPGLLPGEAMLLRARSDGRIEVQPTDDDPRLLTASQLLREYFGLDGLYLTGVGAKVRRYEQLAAVAERSSDEQSEVEALQRELTALRVEHSEPVPRSPAGAVP